MAEQVGYGANTVHYDRVLTQYSVACFADTSNYIAHKIFPKVRVKHLSDKFDFYPSGYFNRVHDERRAEEAVANRINYNTTRRSYICEEWALRTFISDKKRANVDAQRRLDTEATMLVVESLRTGAESRFVKQFLSPGVWGMDWTGVGASPTGNQFIKFSDAASEPIQVFKKLSTEMMLRGLRRPNTAIITRDVWDVLTENAEIMDRIKYGGTNENPTKISRSAISTLLELDRIEIMDSIYNAAPDGLIDPNTGLPPTDYQFMATGKILLLNLDSRVGTMAANAAVTFVPDWLGAGSDGAPVIRRYRESDAVRGDWIEGEWCYDQQVVCPDLGILLSDVI